MAHTVMGHNAFLLGSAIASLVLSATPFIAAAGAQPAINLDQLTATQAAADLCAGKITSKALTAAALARAKKLNRLNAFVTLDEAGAMKAAEAFDASHKAGSCKPLGGVPVVVKDNIEVAGLPSSAGTPALKSYVPAKDGRWPRSCAKPARSSSARPTCTSLPLASPATTARSRQARNSACAMPMIRPRSPAVRHRARERRSARASSPRASAPTPAARGASPAR